MLLKVFSQTTLEGIVDSRHPALPPPACCTPPPRSPRSHGPCRFRRKSSARPIERESIRKAGRDRRLRWPPLTPGAAERAKKFYLEEFYGKSLLFTLIPPPRGAPAIFIRCSRTVRELRRNRARCVGDRLASDPAKIVARMGRMRPPVFDPARRSRPYPPDAAVAAIWQTLRAGSIVVAGAAAKAPARADHLRPGAPPAGCGSSSSSCWNGQGGLAARDGEQSFLELRGIAKRIQRERSALRRALLRRPPARCAMASAQST